MSYDIIVVEPDRINQRTTEELLEPIGVTCKFISGPDELESCRLGSNIILMNCCMENCAATRKLRANSIHVPIIALRKYEEETSDEELYEAGFDAIISEPYSPFRFQQIVWNFLRLEKGK